MLCCEQVGTCGTHARDDTCRLATNWTHRTSRIETKDVQDVSKIEADGLNIDHRLRQDKSMRWHPIRLNDEIGDGANLSDVYLMCSCICHGPDVSHRLLVKPWKGMPTIREVRTASQGETRAPQVNFRAPCQEWFAGRFGAPTSKSEHLRRVRSPTKGKRLADAPMSRGEHRVRNRPAVPK